MIVVFDLDYVLLDTSKFKGEMSRVFGFNNIENEINVGIEKLLKKVDDYLFKEAEEIIEYYKHNEQEDNLSNELYLLTKGDPEWQKAKLQYSKLNNIFGKNNIKFSEGRKIDSEFLSSIKKIKTTKKQEGEKLKIFIINDKTKENDEIKEYLELEESDLVLIKDRYSKDDERAVSREDFVALLKEKAIKNETQNEIKMPTGKMMK